MSGGGGGGGKVKTRIADYFMSVHYGICAGPVDSIDAIKVDGKDIGMSAMSGNGTVAVNNQGLFGGYRKYGGVGGLIDIMLGGVNQIVTAALATRLGRTPLTCPGFRGVTSIFMYQGVSSRVSNNGFYWRSNMPSLPPVSAVVTRIPKGPNGDSSPGPNGLANPAHIIYECLFNTDWGMGYPVNMYDVVSFQDSATRLANEGLFLALIWVRSTTIEAFCGEILDHIQASLGPDPRTGKIRLKLLRDDYDVNNLRVLHPGNAKITNIQRKLWGETANSITVSWTNPASEKEETVTIHDDANIAIQGQVVSTSRNYYGVRSAELASRLALRDLRQVASPLLAVDIEIDRTEWDIMPGEVIELRWPSEQIASVYMRVGDVDYGATANSRIRTSLVEDIFGLGSSVYESYTPPKPGDPAPVYPPPKPGEEYVPPTPTPIPPTVQPPTWVDPTEKPRPLDYALLDTAPYFMLARAYGDGGLEGINYPSVSTFRLVSQNSNDTASIGEWVEVVNAVGASEFELIGLPRNTFRAGLATALTVAVRSTVAAPTTNTGNLVRPGYMLWIANQANPEISELAAIESISEDGTQWVLRRGALDTLPLAWPVGTPIWAFDPTDGSSFDPTVRADGQEVDYKYTPITTGGALDLSLASEVQVTLTDRPYLPYRPANVQFNGVVFATLLTPLIDQDLVVTWARRNRISETGQLMLWNDGDVAPEVGQTTFISIRDSAGVETARFDNLPGTSFTIPAAAVASFPDSGTVQVGSERDGMESLHVIKASISMANFVGYGMRYGVSYGN